MLKQVFNRSFASLVTRLSHHPSIFGWVLSNEIVWSSACLPPAPQEQAAALPGVIHGGVPGAPEGSTGLGLGAGGGITGGHNANANVIANASAGGAQCSATCGEPCSPPQFVELYRFANSFDPERPCWFADGSFGVTTDPGLRCRNGVDPDNKFCFCDVMVAQSYWSHTNAGTAVEKGSGISPAAAAAMPVPYLMHEVYDARTFPRLEANLAAFHAGGNGGVVKAGVWLNGSIARLQQLGLLHENDVWSLASEREYSMWLKAFIEAYRLDNAVSGSVSDARNTC